MKRIALLFIPILIFSMLKSECRAQSGNQSEHQTLYQSDYVGEHQREIKSLSNEDIEALLNGEGWGLAKAAELNGVPGPSHILDMKSEIDLSESQLEQIQAVFDNMNSRAKKVGELLIKKERELNSAFAEKEITVPQLETLTSEIGAIRGELTFIHLKAHLEASKVLSSEQTRLYNELRGYDLISDPCKEIPEGHDPEMWKKHNNCTN